MVSHKTDVFSKLKSDMWMDKWIANGAEYTNYSMSNRATISETFVKERYIASHQDKRIIFSILQMKICGLNSKRRFKSQI